ncbi:MAG: acetylglutamate kinase [Candidatus Binatia bacterium]
MDKLIAKAEVLLEALPYIRRFAGRTIVIKYGGHAMVDEELRSGFAVDLVLLKSLGLNPVVVHGGGPQIGETLDRLGIASSFVRGMRVTDKATMDIVEMVLGGQINMSIVSMIQAHGGRAVGLSGKDGNLVQAQKMNVPASADGDPVDLGMVGSVKNVDPQLLHKLIATDFIPVVAPIGADGGGQSYNINADVVASSLAQAIGAAKLMMLTDVDGIMNARGEVQAFITVRQAREWIADGSINEGMIPKVECAVSALEQGVGQVHVIDGRVSHAVLLEIFTRRGVGTEVVLEPPGEDGDKR